MAKEKHSADKITEDTLHELLTSINARLGHLEDIEADNHKSILSFSADSKEMNDAFECVCVQHEIDHLDGITMFDREFKQEPIKRVVKKIGRNEKVMITKGSESKNLKYKKAEPLLEDGWVLSN